MEYRTRTTITVNAELDILKDIKELCEKERKSLSEKINELMIGELEKKALGDYTPINVSYNKAEEKPLQSDIRQWLDKKQAIIMARKSNLSLQEWHHLKDIICIIDRKVTTGYLHID